MGVTVIADLKRFWRLVDTANIDGCWLWRGADDGRGGYGKFKVDGVSVRAIRWIFEVYNPGKLRTHHKVMHTCDTRACVRPDHLVKGTHRQNMRDMAAKGRNVMRRPFLDLDTVCAIKFAGIELGISPVKIARELNLNYSTVRSIVEGRSWKAA